MALFSCPECKQQISDTGTSCPKCGYVFPKNIGDIKRKQEIASSKAGKGCLITALVFIGIIVISLNINSNREDSLKERVGYCDICGRKSAYTQGGIDLCSSCFDGYLNFSYSK